jgi:ATPase subunit of ABC transporter with duplicated ATPase domains
MEGDVLFKQVDFTVEKDDKIVFLSKDPRAMTALFEIISGNKKPTAGILMGRYRNIGILPLDNSQFLIPILVYLIGLLNFLMIHTKYFCAGI